MQKAKSRQIPGRSALIYSHLEVETESKLDFAKYRVASRADRAIVRGVAIVVLGPWQPRDLPSESALILSKLAHKRHCLVRYVSKLEIGGAMTRGTKIFEQSLDRRNII
jgi:hypothetical protein